MATVNNIPDFLKGGGPLGEHLRRIDWGSTSLGQPEDWDESLKNGISEILKIAKQSTVAAQYESLPDILKAVSDAIEGGDLGTFDFHPKINQAIWSDKTKELFGIPPDEPVTFESFLKSIHPDDRKKRQEMLQDSMLPENGGLYDHEYRTVSKIDNRIRCLRSKGKVLFDEDGNPERVTGIVQDITKQKETEERNKMLISIIEASHEFIGLVDMDTTIQYGNPAALKMLGWDSIEGKDIMDCLYPEDYGIAAKLIPQLIKTGSFEDEVRFINAKTKKPFWLQWNAFAIRNEAGEIIRFGTVSTDITQRKQAEIILKESEQRFRMLADQSPIMIFIIEPDEMASVSYWNQTWLDYTGQPYDKALGTMWNEFIHPDDVVAVMDAYLPAFQNRTSYFIEAVRLKRYDGTYRWHMFKGNPRFTETGEFAGFIGVGFDIHEKKIAEELLKESEERFRTLAQRLPQLVWITDEAGNQEFASAKWKEYSGIMPQNLESWNEIVHPDDVDKISRAWDLSRKTGKIYKTEVRLRNKSGEYRWHSVNGQPIYDSNQNLVKWVGAFTDIHTEKTFSQSLENQVEERTNELLHKNEDLERMNKELESFAYISSHDLQEPLRKIQTFASRILEHDYDTLSDKAKDYFKKMENAALRMKTLIEDLLAYSRTNTEDRVYETTPLNEIIDEVREDFSDEIVQQHATIEAEELCDVDIIPFQFRQLMHNLVANSIKFAKSDEPAHILIRSEIAPAADFHIDKLDPGKKYCHISVSDNGIGFSPEYNEKIFEVFQRLHGRETYDGTGIGLAIVKKIVDNHEGLIMAHGKTNEGATFDIYIPSSENN